MENKIKQFKEIRINNDLIYLFSNIYNENKLKKEIKNYIKSIFEFNNFSISEKTLNKYFEITINFIYENLKDNTIKNSNDLKFYIENELYLVITNNQYLFKTFFNNEYKQIKNYLFV